MNRAIRLVCSVVLLVILTPSVAFSAPPKGAVKLARSKLVQKDGFFCGNIRGKTWVPGRRISGGYFYSYQAERTNLRGQLKRASKKSRSKIRAQIDALTSLIAARSAACATSGATKLSIVGAKTLVLLPTSTASSVKVSATTNTLFKVSPEGFMQEATFTNDEGKSVSTQRNPVGVYDVNQDYIIVVFGIDELNISDGYLVRKGDGKIFSLANAGFPSRGATNTNFKNGKVVQTDHKGDIYYKVRSYSSGGFGVFDLVKIGTSNPDQLTSIPYSPSDESIYNFVVNSQGNIIYNSRLKTDLNAQFYRIKKSNGGFQNIPIDSTYWVGIDQNFYYQKSASAVKKLVIDDTGTVTSSDYGAYSFNIPSISGSYKFDFSDRQVFAETVSNRVAEVINPSNNPRLVSGLPITLTLGAQSDNYYYLAGNDSNSNPTIIRVNPQTDEYVQLYTPGKYDVYEMAVSRDDIVTFSALRLSDGKKVFVRIDSIGNESVINDELNVRATTLVQIN